jgi:hypothetical protein
MGRCAVFACISDFLKKYQDKFIFQFIVLLVTTVFIMIALDVSHLIDFHFINNNALNPSNDSGSSGYYYTLDFHAGVMVVLTFFIALIAWSQLAKVRHSINSDYLLRIIQNYSSEEVINARHVIHRLHVKAKNQVKLDNPSFDNNLINIATWESVANMILEIKNSDEKNDMRDFSYLLSFIDFLETISYFANQGKIDKNELNNMIGHSLNFYFKIFNLFIKSRRNSYAKKDYYYEFEKLINALKLSDYD